MYLMICSEHIMCNNLCCCLLGILEMNSKFSSYI